MSFSFNHMARSALAGEEDFPPFESAMDLSFEAAAPSVVTQKTSRKQHHTDDMPCTDGGDIGYLGWPARKLLVACHRIFLKGLLADGDQSVVAMSLEHRGVIFWSLSNMDADTEDRPEDEQSMRDEDIFHDGLTDFYHVWTLAEAFLLDSMPLPAASLLRWLKMYCLSNENPDSRFELDEAEAAALEGHEDVDTGSGSYWKAVRSLVMSVQPRRAANMLRSHPNGRDSTEEVGALARQLEKMPLLLAERPTEGESGEENEGGGGEGGAARGGLEHDPESFFGTWTRWQKGCKDAASSFGVMAGAGGGSDGQGGRGAGDERRELRWLWGTLCGERRFLEEGTDSWAGLFAAVLAFERPDVRKEEVAVLMRECEMKYPTHDGEDFLLRVIRDASTGAVDAILRFAEEHGNTLALSACAAHLVHLLARAELPSVTNAQRSWFFDRLAKKLRAFPCGGWELAAAYVSGDGSDDSRRDGGSSPSGSRGSPGFLQASAAAGRDGPLVRGGETKRGQLLRDIAKAVAPGSERAAHELVEWCRVSGLGEEAVAEVCRARGAAWIAKTGFSAAAMGIAEVEMVDGGEGEEPLSSAGGVVSGACGKAAYWLAKSGGGIQLERLCAEVSERLMVDVADVVSDAQAAKAALDEAEGVLAAIPPGISGPELSFLERYKEIADKLMESDDRHHRHQRQNALLQQQQAQDDPYTCAAGVLAVRLLTSPPPIAEIEMSQNGSGRQDSAGGGGGNTVIPAALPAPPRTWAHLLRLALPALRASAEAAEDISSEGDTDVVIVTAPQVHALLGKLQTLVASEHRVGSGGGASGRPSTLALVPEPYGFCGGHEEILNIRRALARCLGGALMVQNAQGGRGRRVAAAGRGRGGGGNRKRLPADALIVPRVSVVGLREC